MRYLFFLSLVSVLRSSIANPLLVDLDESNLNLFVDSNTDPLFPHELTELPVDNADSALDLASLIDPDSDIFGSSDSVELLAGAGADDFCAADGEFQIIGRMRARDTTRCGANSLSQQDINHLTIPNIFKIFEKKDPPPQTDSETNRSPQPGSGASPNELICSEPFRNHLCCNEPATSENLVIRNILYYDKMKVCTPGIAPYPDREIIIHPPS